MKTEILDLLISQMPEDPKDVEGIRRWAEVVQDSLSDFISERDDVGGPRGTGSFEAAMLQLNSIDANIKQPKVFTFEMDPDSFLAKQAELQKQQKKANTDFMRDIAKTGIAAGFAVSTGNPAAALPLLKDMLFTLRDKSDSIGQNTGG